MPNNGNNNDLLFVTMTLCSKTMLFNRNSSFIQGNAVECVKTS